MEEIIKLRSLKKKFRKNDKYSMIDIWHILCLMNAPGAHPLKHIEQIKM